MGYKKGHERKTFNLSQDKVKLIQQIAKDTGRSESDIVREALDFYLNSNKVS